MAAFKRKWIHRKPFKCFDFLLSKFEPEGHVDDFTAKCGHCNGIQVNGIDPQGYSAETFALTTIRVI